MPPKKTKLIPADLKVVELRKELSARGLPTKGLKKELIVRLEEALEPGNKSEDQEVEIEDKSAAESPIDLETQQQPPEIPPAEDSDAKPEEVVDSAPLDEPTSTTPGTSNIQENLQDIADPQTLDSESDVVAEQTEEITENQIEAPLQGSAVETDGKSLEAEDVPPVPETSNTSIQDPNQASIEADLSTQTTLDTSEKMDTNTYPESTIAQSGMEDAPIDSNLSTIPPTSELNAPRSDAFSVPVSTTTTETTYAESTIAQTVAEVAPIDSNLSTIPPTSEINAPQSDTFSVSTTYTETTYPDLTITQSISEFAPPHSDSVTVPIFSEASAPQSEVPASTTHTESGLPESIIAQTVSVVTSLNSNLVSIPLTPEFPAPQDALSLHFPTTCTESTTTEKVKVQNMPAVVDPLLNIEAAAQAQDHAFDTIQVLESISHASLNQNNSVVEFNLNQTQDPQGSMAPHATEPQKEVIEATLAQEAQTNGHFLEQLHTATTENLSMEESTVIITDECQVTSEIVPSYDIPQSSADDDKTISSELNNHAHSASNSPMDTNEQHQSDEMNMDTDAPKPLDEKPAGAEPQLDGLPVLSFNDKQAEESAVSQEPSHVEKHSPGSTGAQPQPMNTLPSHEMSPRAEDEAVYTPSPKPQEDQKYSVNTDGKPLKFVAITNLTRPFPLSDFEEQLREYGPLDVFWIDKFRSHCYAQYETSAGAIQCQSMLSGVQFPPETGKKLDVVLLDEAEGQLLLQKEKDSSERFILSIEENKPQLTLYSESRRASVRSAPPTRHASLKEQDSPKRELPDVQPDEHFCKTSTKPPLYYKPTKDLDTPSPDAVAEKRSRENSISDDAHSELDSGSPVLKQARID